MSKAIIFPLIDERRRMTLIDHLHNLDISERWECVVRKTTQDKTRKQLGALLIMLVGGCLGMYVYG